MDFRFTEEGAGLIGAVRDFLTGLHSPEMLRALDAKDVAKAEQIAGAIAEMGLPGFMVPEALGGLGRSLPEAAAVAVECGRVALAAPLIDTALIAAPLLLRVGGQDELLRSIASGDARFALAHPANGWVLDADDATHVLSASDDGVRIGAVGDIRGADSIDPLRMLGFVSVEPGGAPLCSGDDLLAHAALMTAGQALGLAEAMLRIAADYAVTRQQFGQPIGAFQAIKHHCANVAVAIEFARPVLWRAAYALEQASPHAQLHVSHALIATRAAAIQSAETAIQVHGAMGYTYEVDLHFWMKRAWAMNGAWGSHQFHQSRIDAGLFGEMLPIGPSHSFA